MLRVCRVDDQVDILGVPAGHVRQQRDTADQEDQREERRTTASSMAKLYASETAVRAAEEGVQIHGGYGFVKDYPAEKFFRDVKLTTIGEGTSEIQRLVIARQLIGN